jgi:hypothetical protein
MFCVPRPLRKLRLFSTRIYDIITDLQRRNESKIEFFRGVISRLSSNSVLQLQQFSRENVTYSLFCKLIIISNDWKSFCKLSETTKVTMMSSAHLPLPSPWPWSPVRLPGFWPGYVIYTWRSSRKLNGILTLTMTSSTYVPSFHSSLF